MYTILSVFVDPADAITVMKDSPGLSISTEPFRSPFNLYVGTTTTTPAEASASVTTCDRLIAALQEVRKHLLVQAVGAPADPKLRLADDSNRPEK
jgi:hypothetical protein